MSHTTIYTDGGSHGNPGPGAWAYIVQHSDRTLERSGSEPHTTNNRMELQAVIEALGAVRAEPMDEHRIVVFTDSQYVRNGITSWIHSWLRNGWKTAAKKPVKNQDLWMQLHQLDTALTIDWQWVRGHSGQPQNERCDQLVQKAIAERSAR